MCLVCDKKNLANHYASVLRVLTCRETPTIGGTIFFKLFHLYEVTRYVITILNLLKTNISFYGTQPLPSVSVFKINKTNCAKKHVGLRDAP